jgi:hypothetical protein
MVSFARRNAESVPSGPNCHGCLTSSALSVTDVNCSDLGRLVDAIRKIAKLQVVTRTQPNRVAPLPQFHRFTLRVCAIAHKNARGREANSS